MAKRANYGFVKRQKELQRQQRKDEKAEKKRLKADSAAEDGQLAAVENDEKTAEPTEEPSQGAG